MKRKKALWYGAVFGSGMQLAIALKMDTLLIGVLVVRLDIWYSRVLYPFFNIIIIISEKYLLSFLILKDLIFLGFRKH